MRNNRTKQAFDICNVSIFLHLLTGHTVHIISQIVKYFIKTLQHDPKNMTSLVDKQSRMFSLWSSSRMRVPPLLAIHYQTQPFSSLSYRRIVLVHLLLKAPVQGSAEIIRDAHSVSSLSAPLSVFLFYLPLPSIVQRLDWVVEKQVDRLKKPPVCSPPPHTHTRQI